MPENKCGGVTVILTPEEQETAELIAQACPEALQVIQETWGLGAPRDCRISVMTSWRKFVFQSAPWYRCLWLAKTYPLWSLRFQRTWPIIGALTLRYGKRVAIGIKPPRLLEQSDKSIGRQVFEEEKDLKIKIRHFTCHELTHACSARLRLPMWLNEGLAMVTVDRYLKQRTVRPDTLDLVKNYQPKTAPPTYRHVSRSGKEALAYQTVRGYWLVQYLEDMHPGLLKRLLSGPAFTPGMEEEIAQEIGLKPYSLWTNIDNILVAYFRSSRPSQ